MAKEAFDSIMAGLSDAMAYAKGDKSRGKAHVVEVPTVDVAAARKKLGLTQEGFASVFRVSVGTVRNWEQKRRRPLDEHPSSDSKPPQIAIGRKRRASSDRLHGGGGDECERTCARGRRSDSLSQDR